MFTVRKLTFWQDTIAGYKRYWVSARTVHNTIRLSCIFRRAKDVGPFPHCVLTNIAVKEDFPSAEPFPVCNHSLNDPGKLYIIRTHQVAHYRWHSTGGTLQVALYRWPPWGGTIMVAQFMGHNTGGHYRWHTTCGSIQVAHYRWHTRDDTIQVAHFKWHTTSSTLQVAHNRWPQLARDFGSYGSFFAKCKAVLKVKKKL